MVRFALAFGAALAVSAPAYAFPPPGAPVLNPLILTGNGTPASAIFAFEDAGDTSNLNLTVPAFGLVFNNQTASPGDSVSVGSPVGQVTFELENISTGSTFFNNVADADGNYHFFATTDYADFSVGALDAAVQAAIDALPMGTNFVFVGAEDRDEAQGSDFDYNDIIYVFTQLEATQTPAPAALALFGLGLAGLAVARRRA